MSTTLKFALLVLGAAVLAFTARVLYANMANQNIKPAERSVQVRVAAGDLPAGLLLREEDLDWKPLEASKVPDGTLVQGTKAADAMGGVLIRRDTKAGAFILARDVIRSDAPGFLAAVLKPGMRAVSVSVDNVSGNAGLIQIGDYVDMILTQQKRNNDDIDSDRSRSVVSETVVEKVRVIAVGSVFQKPTEEQSNSKTKGSASTAAARTVTLEVTSRAAEAITVASRLGTLSMALRSFAVADRNAPIDEQAESVVAWDNNTEKSNPVWAGDISRAIGNGEPPKLAVEATPNVAPREVTIFRGSKRETQSFDGMSATAH
ncbi:MAG TPA: Flp pilus assembly protein CpaB [Eoetvoesiella sp.]